MAVAKCPKCKLRRLDMRLAAPLEADITRKGENVTVSLTALPVFHLWCTVCHWAITGVISRNGEMVIDKEEDQ